MNRRKMFIAMSAILALPLVTPHAHSEDMYGHIQLSGTGQAAWPLGQHSFTDQADNVGVDVGGMVASGFSHTLSLGLSYDNVDVRTGTRVEPILMNAIIRTAPDKRLTPNIQLGVGLVEGITDEKYEHIAAKVGLGLEYFATPNFSLGPQITYLLADVQTLSKQYAHIVTAGLLATLSFGDSKEEPKAAAPPAVVAMMAISPAETTLGPGQTAQFNASNASSAVTWSIKPHLGSISPNGVYTAPETISFPETITLTATSVADGSRMATGHIRLQPPAQAPKEVSIRMDILFDHDKTDVNPKYNGEIAKVAEFMSEYDHTKAEIDGHSDNVGDAAYNLKLSQRRADSVRAYMIEKFNIDASRLSAKGYGETQPIAPNDTDAGRAQNRRVVAVLTSQE